jgi:hypothetical protein
MYDPKCHDLATEFLAEERPALRTDAHVQRLAQVIQDAIEDEIEAMRDASDAAVEES